jgi:hypothetical protein
MMDARADLIQVFRDARALLARPDNRIGWASGWESLRDGLAEVDSFLDALKDGGEPPSIKMRVLFGPTSDMQEVSIASGWPNEFLALAERFDHALERFDRQHSLRVVKD